MRKCQIYRNKGILSKGQRIWFFSMKKSSLGRGTTFSWTDVQTFILVLSVYAKLGGG